MLTGCGIDFVFVDNQHGSWGSDSTIAAFMAISTGPATPIARVARNDYTMVGRLLDEGCMGVVFPMIHTAEDAKTAADSVRLPPVGTRSWGWGRAARYGDDYPDWINEQVLCIVQIESIQAVENAEAIMATPGVDGCWLGPGDMALSMGIHPRDMAKHEEHARAVERVLQACRNTGKIPGFAGGSLQQAADLAKQGFQLLTAAGDAGFLLSGATAGVKFLKG